MNKIKSIGLSFVVISAFSIGFIGCGGGSDSTAPSSETISDDTSRLNIKEIVLSTDTLKKIDSIKAIIDNELNDEDTLLDTLSIKKEIEVIDGVIIEESTNDDERAYLKYTVDGYGYVINDTKSDSLWSANIVKRE